MISVEKALQIVLNHTLDFGIEEIREMDVLEAVYPILGAMAAD